MKNINFASRPYFSEQGNVDDDATFITIAVIQLTVLLPHAVCSLQMSYTAILEHSGQLRKSGLELLQNPGSLPGKIITQTKNRKAIETVRGY